ncbi:DUF2948 family protein [Fodinicurvata sp. EGI_FJ10296]|uniref:DUF2948 family protein n=1 Tax=Fodinicurvata sp. EGI_FJ10296 TaxID=3231908 RepID=UPI0034560AF1
MTGSPTDRNIQASGASDASKAGAKARDSAPLPAVGTPAPLRLRARDADDLLVLSAQLQDAIVPVMDMAFLKDEKLFAMVVNRFRWDVGMVEDSSRLGSDEDDEAEARGEDGGGHYYRTNAAVRVSSVTHVASKGIDIKDRGAFLNILAITADAGATPGEVEILIAFSGGAWTRLTALDLDILLEDLGEPWPTNRMPDHGLADDDGSGA